jgi:GntR family transcriptional regulator
MRLAALIRDQIASGTLTAGGPLPSIAVLRRRHSHSRQTVGKAMRILEGEGLIYRVPGLGYYISQGVAVTPHGQVAAEVPGEVPGDRKGSSPAS